MEWAAALMAHNLLLRAGELCCTEIKEFSTERCITWASFQWWEPCYESRGLPWFEVDVTAIKDAEFTHTRVPMAVRKRGGGSSADGDITCVYTAVKALWDARRHVVTDEQCVHGAHDSPPFFVDELGRPWTSRTSRELALRMGVAAGFPPDHTGGKMWRIGGATELRISHGVEKGRQLIVDRGRWRDRDIGFIYSRALLEDHLDASAAMGEASGSRDMEEVFRGWVQPAAFR